jgi:hypothetical protein
MQQPMMPQQQMMMPQGQGQQSMMSPQLMASQAQGQQQQFVVTQQTHSGNQTCHAMCAVRRGIWSVIAALLCVVNLAVGNIPVAILMAVCSLLLFVYTIQHCNKAMQPDQVSTTVTQVGQQQQITMMPAHDPNMQRGYQPPAMPGLVASPPMVVAAVPVLQASAPPAAKSLDDVLNAASLSHVRAAIMEIGVGAPEDFVDVADEDLVECGLKPIEIKRLRRHLE